MMVKPSNTAITYAAVLWPSGPEWGKEEILDLISIFSDKFQKSEQEQWTYFEILQVEHSFSEKIMLS